MTHQDEIKPYVENRLQQWADWVTRVVDFGLGYPHKSIEAQLIDGGGLIIRGTGVKVLPTNTNAEEIEHHVRELAQQNIRLATVLREYYCGRGHIRRKAVRVGLSCSTFKVSVRMAKQWISGKLQANNLKFNT